MDAHTGPAYNHPPSAESPPANLDDLIQEVSTLHKCIEQGPPDQFQNVTTFMRGGAATIRWGRSPTAYAALEIFKLRRGDTWYITHIEQDACPAGDKSGEVVRSTTIFTLDGMTPTNYIRTIGRMEEDGSVNMLGVEDEYELPPVSEKSYGDLLKALRGVMGKSEDSDNDANQQDKVSDFSTG